MTEVLRSDTGLHRFFVLTFGISWVCWLVVALSGRAVAGDAGGDLEAAVTVLAGGFGPTVAAIFGVYRMGDAARLTRRREEVHP
jgi:hypothetical protein